MKLLFVCLGNICRSSAAETIMNQLIEQSSMQNKIQCDSAGIIAVHQGEPADSRMRHHASLRGYNITHISRPIEYNDFFDFDLIFAMDDNNWECLCDKAPTADCQKKIRHITDYCAMHNDRYVPDPYYGGAEGFEYVLDLLEDACKGILEKEIQ